MTTGELRYRLRCLDKLGFTFRGHESVTLALGHEHFSRRRFRALVSAVFPDARFGAFEAHYVPGMKGSLALQHFVEEALERLPPAWLLMSYNFAVA